MRRLWRRFTIWYLGPEFPPDYVPLKRVGWSPIPVFHERTHEYLAYLQARRIMRMVEEIENRE